MRIQEEEEVEEEDRPPSQLPRVLEVRSSLDMSTHSSSQSVEAVSVGDTNVLLLDSGFQSSAHVEAASPSGGLGRRR